MRVVILAGGLGTRISEETQLKPKPMVELGGMPIIWHLMKIYSAHGINDFVICCGYKGYQIKEFFANYYLHSSDITVDIGKNSVEVIQREQAPWRVTLVDTGDQTMTGGRLKRVKSFVEDDECFCFTYADGLSDVDVTGLIAFHKSHGRKATLTAALPPGRFGALSLDGDTVSSFNEKPRGDGAMVNGGFFVLSPSVIDYIEDDSTVWEAGPLENLAAEKQLAAYRHDGFWQPMDTLRDRVFLESLWTSKKAPWKVWA
jgi:glucose-1-phosphate cytidylyltransferase